MVLRAAESMMAKIQMITGSCLGQCLLDQLSLAAVLALSQPSQVCISPLDGDVA